MKQLILALLLTTPLFAQTLPSSRQEITLTFSPVVKRAAPAVVNVYASRIEQARQNPLANDPFWGRFFGNAPRDNVARSLGSGVIVESDGLIVTNNHVIENMTQVKVALQDKREFEAEILLRDPRTDLAVLKLKGVNEKLAALELGDPEKSEVGDLVLAIGNPFGVGQTVTQGIISALARSQVGVGDYQSFIQTDAAINPGNSGGALVDMRGALLGINTAIFSRSGGSHGIGFAIPSPMVRVVLASAKAGSKIVRRPWLGLKTENVTSEIAESLGLSRPAGVLVKGVLENSPALKAGLKAGDVITKIDDTQVDEPDSFGYRLAIKPLNSNASLTVLRGGKPVLLTLALLPAPKGKEDRLELKGNSPFQGATVQSLSPALEEELGLDLIDQGVVIVESKANSPALNLGFQKGDVLLMLNGQKINSVADVERVTNERARVWRIEILRNGQVLRSVLGG
jgi:Do/DeqQ family serine protease